MCLRNIWMPPLVIEATDKDSGINALLVYEILEAEAKTFFAIDESTGALRTMVSLDFETKQRFEFEVRVSDRGLPRLTADSTTKVSLKLFFLVKSRLTPISFLLGYYTS
jgi:protocadherin Fat 1/2/3